MNTQTWELSDEEAEAAIAAVLTTNSERFRQLSEISDWQVFAMLLREYLGSERVALYKAKDAPDRAFLPPKVEKGVPMPGWRNRKYPWDTMQIGDSFWAPTSAARLLTLAASHTKYHNNGRHYYCRPEGNGARIWRVAPPKG